ncbi:pectate lyase family protein [Flavobacterium agrisoli]|uniref:T9SS type A sorting domain-containing protein n=1 Tax=Flavobacterium agrisoli TaxID=2793066 RepID=A0A934PIQ5_9FLAO|nr:T9SS type A sorting domain-containing protein [Flavobacterium agrisoli]MBK0368392.1 T9SS type A sorting domain-containing protein [Flavobacterium agrisoli]
MKKISLLAIFLLSISNLFAQKYYMDHPEGFGAATTGGGTPNTSNTVTVSNYSDLESALTSTSPTNAVILVSGTIECSYTSVKLNNKTIIGLPGARLVNLKQVKPTSGLSNEDNSGILTLKPGSSNVIIRNLVFEGPGAWDVGGKDNLSIEGCVNLWVDHCEFQDGMDGNLDMKDKTDNVTISWCKFTYKKIPKTTDYEDKGTPDHRFSSLIGSGSSNSPDDGHFSITFQNCYWAEGCKERMPRARNAELHILNCYYNTSLSSSLAIGLGGGTKNSTCYVEGTNFSQVTSTYKSYPADGGTIAINFDNCLKGAANIGTVNKPTYAYTAIPVNLVEAAVTNTSCGAGATLQVTNDGIISASCSNDNLGVNEIKSTLELKYYPTVIDSLLNIDFSANDSGKAVIEMYAANGSKVYTQSKNIAPNEKLELNVASLGKGMYFCKVFVNDKAKSFKVLKD